VPIPSASEVEKFGNPDHTYRTDAKGHRGFPNVIGSAYYGNVTAVQVPAAQV
jgi:hypothetical protein